MNSGKKRLGEVGISVARAGMASISVGRGDTGFRFTIGVSTGCHCTWMDSSLLSLQSLNPVMVRRVEG